MPGASEETTLKELVEGHPDLAFNEENTKVKCISTGSWAKAVGYWESYSTEVESW